MLVVLIWIDPLCISPMLFSWDYPNRENSVKSFLSIQVTINFSRCLQKSFHSMYRGKKRTQNTKKAHLCNRSSTSPQETLWPQLADLPSATVVIFTPLAQFHVFSCPVLQVTGVLSFMSCTKSLHCQWHFTDLSVRGMSHIPGAGKQL